MYYVGTVTLNMSPKVFWRSTPRKLTILAHTHAEINAVDNDEKGKQKQTKKFIDEVF